MYTRNSTIYWILYCVNAIVRSKFGKFDMFYMRSIGIYSCWVLCIIPFRNNNSLTLIITRDFMVMSYHYDWFIELLAVSKILQWYFVIKRACHITQTLIETICDLASGLKRSCSFFSTRKEIHTGWSNSMCFFYWA